MELKPRTVVGVAVLIERDDCYLMIQRAKTLGFGQWSPPGGRLEFRETLENCAAREVKEETGITITNVKFSGVTNDLHSEVDWHGVTIWMKADYLDGEPRVSQPDEIRDARWIPKNSLPKELFCPFQQLLNHQVYR